MGCLFAASTCTHACDFQECYNNYDAIVAEKRKIVNPQTAASARKRLPELRATQDASRYQLDMVSQQLSQTLAHLLNTSCEGACEVAHNIDPKSSDYEDRLNRATELWKVTAMCHKELTMRGIPHPQRLNGSAAVAHWGLGQYDDALDVIVRQVCTKCVVEMCMPCVVTVDLLTTTQHTFPNMLSLNAT